MFETWKNRKERNQMLEEQIRRRLQIMRENGVDSEQFTAAEESVNRLYELRWGKPTERINPNTIIVAVGSIGGILICAFADETRVILKSGLGFVLRGRV